MKSLVWSLLVLPLLATPAFCKIAIISKEEMVCQADLVAIVNIQELASTDKSRVYVDLIASGAVRNRA